MTKTMPIYSVKLKTRKEINRDIPREKQGWWADVCPGQSMYLRDATKADVERCHCKVKDPALYFCELESNGSLISKIAASFVHQIDLPIPD